MISRARLEAPSEWHAALGTSKRYRSAVGWQRFLGISLEELDRLTRAIGTALDGRILTREELLAEVGRLMGSKTLAKKMALNSWGTVFKPAALAGHLCFASSLSQRVRFTHPATWLGAAPARVDPQAASLAIVRRYLAAYGPATDHDLSRWWGGASMKTVRGWIASLGHDATPVDLEGTQAWMLAAHARELRDLTPERSVRLLPAFDHYVVAASQYAVHLLPDGLRGRVYRPQGWISPVLLVNGLMQGTWRHEVKSNLVEVTIEPFGKSPGWIRRGAEEEAERLAAFLGGQLDLAISAK